MLNLIGADWAPQFVDFFKGETRTPAIRGDINEMGEAPVLAHGTEEAHPVGRDPQLLAKRSGKFHAGLARIKNSKRCAGSSSTTRRSTGFLGPYRFLKNWAKPAPDPGRARLLQGPHRRQSGDHQQAARRAASISSATSRPSRDVSLCGYLYYPVEEFGFDIGKDYPAIAAWRERMQALPGWKHPLRSDARASDGGVTPPHAS
jgi:glutathione S-transferase